MALHSLRSLLKEQYNMITEEQRKTLSEWINQISSYWFDESRPVGDVAMSYVNRFLEKNPTIVKSCYQLIACAALCVASKVETKYPLTYDYLSDMTDNAYTPREITECELLLLFVLRTTF